MVVSPAGDVVDGRTASVGARDRTAGRRGDWAISERAILAIAPIWRWRGQAKTKMLRVQVIWWDTAPSVRRVDLH